MNTESHGDRAVGNLMADDLGKVVTVVKGGATYTGTLRRVQHSDYGSGGRTMLSLVSGDWHLVEHWPSTEECRVMEQLG